MNNAFNILLFLFISTFVNAQITLDTLALGSITTINESEINSENLEYSPIAYQDFILYVKSNRSNGKDKNLGDYYFDLAYAAKNNKGKLSNTAFFDESINSIMHEGPAAYDAINDILYFTRSYYNVEKGTRRDTVVLKIYEAKTGQKPTPISISSEKYNVCHPTLSRNGQRMVFSSNMPGSQNMDLYLTTKEGNTWKNPERLNLNTSQNEVFPYLYNDSLLVFSKNDDAQITGYDFYFSSLTDTGWTLPIRMPFPINSSFDEIGFYLYPDETSGYFASNRPGGKGKDDIYRFESAFPLIITKSKRSIKNYTINIIDKLTFENIDLANVYFSHVDLNELIKKNESIELAKSGELILNLIPDLKHLYVFENLDKNQKVEVNLETDRTYLVQFKAKGYENHNIIVNTKNLEDKITIVANPLAQVEKPVKKIVVETQPKPIAIPTAVGSSIVFNNIYYEYGSAAIRTDAAGELDQLYQAMLSNPDMRIQLSSHTDSRGNALYNKQLSERRAQAAKVYLTSRGISDNRIVAIGFGEARIRNQCTDGIACSEEEHQYNRRTDVLVID